MNDKVGNLRAIRNDQSTRGGTIRVYDIFARTLSRVDMSLFFDIVKPSTMSVLRSHADSCRTQFKIHFTMVKYGPDGEVLDRFNVIHTSKLLPMFHASDLNELYEMHKNNFIGKFLSLTLQGSGLVLESIEKLQVYLYNYTPFSSFRNNDGNVDVNELD